jgi:hypothetical protein
VSARRAPLARREDWPRRLDAAIRAARLRAFRWGEHDCCLFAADVVDAICGADPTDAIAARFRGRYKTARGARGLLARLGGIDGLMTKVALGPEVAPLMARRGDVVALAPSDGDDSAGVMLGICIGEHVAGAAPAGFCLVPLRAGLRAWRVGGAEVRP